MKAIMIDSSLENAEISLDTIQHLSCDVAVVTKVPFLEKRLVLPYRLLILLSYHETIFGLPMGSAAMLPGRLG